MEKPRAVVSLTVDGYAVEVVYGDNRKREITNRDTIEEANRVAIELAMQTGYVCVTISNR
ncbi:hypothetical protein [Nonomuraea lactucae]|uniref:hypothetical protein n=1 Tax=Nonomuraea lactucae TaxID=2249762 RepID=UPI000DE4A87F|nr:hypothetical protein [Nonomuraea lactucae]